MEEPFNYKKALVDMSKYVPYTGTSFRHALLPILLKYHYFSIVAMSDGLQTLRDRPRVHSLKNQQENKEIRRHITVFIA